MADTPLHEPGAGRTSRTNTWGNDKNLLLAELEKIAAKCTPYEVSVLRKAAHMIAEGTDG